MQTLNYASSRRTAESNRITWSAFGCIVLAFAGVVVAVRGVADGMNVDRSPFGMSSDVASLRAAVDRNSAIAQVVVGAIIVLAAIVAWVGSRIVRGSDANVLPNRNPNADQAARNDDRFRNRGDVVRSGAIDR